MPSPVKFGDPDHPLGEARYILTGRSLVSRLLVVVHLERGARVRLMNARLVTRRERRVYEEAD